MMNEVRGRKRDQFLLNCSLRKFVHVSTECFQSFHFCALCFCALCYILVCYIYFEKMFVETQLSSDLFLRTYLHSLQVNAIFCIV